MCIRDRNSSLATTVAPAPSVTRFRRTSGVLPIRLVTSLWMRVMIPRLGLKGMPLSPTGHGASAFPCGEASVAGRGALAGAAEAADDGRGGASALQTVAGTAGGDGGGGHAHLLPGRPTTLTVAAPHGRCNGAPTPGTAGQMGRPAVPVPRPGPLRCRRSLDGSEPRLCQEAVPGGGRVHTVGAPLLCRGPGGGGAEDVGGRHQHRFVLGCQALHDGDPGRQIVPPQLLVPTDRGQERFDQHEPAHATGDGGVEHGPVVLLVRLRARAGALVVAAPARARRRTRRTT